MPITTKIEPLHKDIDLILSDLLSPQARSKVVADFAKGALADAQQINRNVLGRVPPHTTTVDGRANAPVEAVKPDGVIVFEFELVSDVLIWIGQQLQNHSPVKTGRYQRSHTLFADGAEVRLGEAVPPAAEYVFLSAALYSRKIERGLSKQAPDGVYQTVAVLAQRRFGNIATVKFSSRAPNQAARKRSQRVPAIVVTTR